MQTKSIRIHYEYHDSKEGKLQNFIDVDIDEDREIKHIDNFTRAVVVGKWKRIGYHADYNMIRFLWME